jgi:TonB-dependent SusC/RagA subfamily outer membrane receptor
MKCILNLITILLLINNTQAQITIRAKSIDSNASNKVTIAHMNTQINIEGNMATTKITYTLYNPTNRVLDGNFEFALANNQVITGFALDINGVLREGVVVDKEKGRVAYENTIARKVDPGLLEITNGNNFRARIYPMPAMGNRIIQIQFEQALPYKNSAWQYYLPAMPDVSINKFTLQVNTNRLAQVAKDTASWFAPDFNNNEQHITHDNFNFSKPLSFYIMGDEQVNYLEGHSTHEGIYFYYNQPLPTALQAQKKAPKTITVFWDVSRSHKNTTITKEQTILLQYIQKLKQVQVTIVPFNIIQKKETVFNVQNGDTSTLSTWLNKVQYDGGTNYECLHLPDVIADEVIICSDGIQNYGSKTTKPAQVPLYVINANPKCNPNEMRMWFSIKGGGIIDATQDEVETCVTHLYKGFLLMFIVSSNNALVYPNKPSPITNQIHVTGKLQSIMDSVLICIGTPDSILYKKSIKMATASYFNNRPERLLAQQQIQELLINKEKNKEAIIALGTTFKLVTPFTSLIVLDNVEDYLRYEIVPPADLMPAYTRLKPKYDSIAMFKKEQKLYEKETLRNNVMAEFDTYVKWWGKKINMPGKPVLPAPISQQSMNRNEDGRNNPISGEASPNVARERNRTAAPGNRGEPSELVTIGYGTANKRDVNGSVTVIRGNELSNGPQVGIDQMLQGRAAGVTISQANGTTGAATSIRLRCVGSITNGNEPLYVVDGVVMPDNTFSHLNLNANDIRNVEILKDAASTAIYGSRAVNGVVIINTKSKANRMRPTSEKARRKNRKKNEVPSQTLPIPDKQIVRAWYELLQDANRLQLDTLYTKLVLENEQNYIFYIRAAEKYKALGNMPKALEVLSNLVEINMENHELLRACAYLLESWNMYADAIKIYEQVKLIKGEEPQTYRDLALALCAHKQYEEAIRVLETIPLKHWGDYEERFAGIKSIIINEWNNVLNKNPKLTTDTTLKALKVIMPVDIRICLDWNRDQTDIDLHVIDANGEEVYYSHRESMMGGRISRDFTRGYGPEEFLLKDAKPGTYKVFINYFGDSQQGAIVPTTVKTTVFRNYNKANETKEVQVSVLNKLGSTTTNNERQYLATLEINE